MNFEQWLKEFDRCVQARCQVTVSKFTQKHWLRELFKNYPDPNDAVTKIIQDGTIVENPT